LGKSKNANQIVIYTKTAFRVWATSTLARECTIDSRRSCLIVAYKHSKLLEGTQKQRSCPTTCALN